jgi:hypothetical protein
VLAAMGEFSCDWEVGFEVPFVPVRVISKFLSTSLIPRSVKSNLLFSTRAKKAKNFFF